MTKGVDMIIGIRKLRLRSYLIMCVMLILAAGLPVSNVFGAATACSALFSSNSIAPGQQTRTYLQVNNEGTNPIAWIKVTRSSAEYSIVGASSANWNANTSSTSVIFTGSTLNAGASYNKLMLDIQAGPNEGASTNWTVQVSDNASGANALKCEDAGLDMGVNDGNGPIISDVTVTNLNSKSATISWNNDEPATSRIYYGRNNQYGAATALNSTLVTNHTVTISGLSPGTGYHYQAVSADGATNETVTGDNTFLTGVAGF